jgi:hypothetical protein
MAQISAKDGCLPETGMIRNSPYDRIDRVKICIREFEEIFKNSKFNMRFPNDFRNEIGMSSIR